MSSTNHTTNYNLPQFVGTDKPAWLGDINPALSTIDSTMKANETLANQGISDASTAQTRADNAYTLADGAKTDAGTAQQTANTAISNNEITDGKVTALANQLNISNVTTNNNLGDYSRLTLAQNSTGTLFKFYGTYQINLSHSFSRSAIAGMSGYYGIATNMFLLKSPATAYIVDWCGLKMQNDSTTGKTINGHFKNTSFAVGTDGQIYLMPTDQSGSETGANSMITRYDYFACLYFNEDFGDVIEPED